MLFNGQFLNKIIVSSFRSYCYKTVRRPNLTNLSRKLTAPQTEPTTDAAVPYDISKQLRGRILASGPITVAEYMREVLTNPRSGYYMHHDVFGRQGDFVTSPEISQIFGELVGIWLLNEWRKLGSPSPFQFVELGPGRGTLARDVLKVLTKFKLGADFSMHLVEISPHLSKMQAQNFCYTHETLADDNLPYYQVGTTATGTKAYWHKRLEDVPHGFSLVLAHEFFDALPVHKLEFATNKWYEVLVDLTNDQPDAPIKFRFVRGKAQTPISQLFTAVPGEMRTSLEYSLETERIVGLVAERLEADGGIGLIMDYGHYGDKTDTFRAFKAHALHDPLTTPGTADLTADVDFKRVQYAAEAKNQVYCCGPVEQGVFLQRMQGEARLAQLLDHALPENHKLIKSGYEMLTDPQQMGSRFKFFAMFPSVLKTHLLKYPVAGFS